MAHYTSAVSNIKEGTAYAAPNNPNYTGSDNGRRHCAAWEQVNPAFQQVVSCLEDIRGRWPYSEPTDSIIADAAASIMPKNRGE